MPTLEEMSEEAASITHDLRTLLESLAAELSETEAGFRLLKNRQDADARERLIRAARRLGDLVESNERMFATVKGKFRRVADSLE